MSVSAAKTRHTLDFSSTVDYLVRTQEEKGNIPWFRDGHTDPWDHVESAMGLTIGGELDAAKRAYRWLSLHQQDDGSWWSAYKFEKLHGDPIKETNFTAYIATGLWHYYKVTGDLQFLNECWSMVEKAMSSVLKLQSEYGDIPWAIDKYGKVVDESLITGCSSIYKSLECIANIATTLNYDSQHWLSARKRLGDALLCHPERFDRSGESKQRYSMDWFYPVLASLISPEQAMLRLNQRWDEFVKPGLGCLCVSDQPWVTIAESCELTMSLIAAGDMERAALLFSWLHQWRLPDGSYWTGYQFELDVMWPDEKPTWTAAAVLLAADALFELTPACQLFTCENVLSSNK
jgi:hypothetical protein